MYPHIEAVAEHGRLNHVNIEVGQFITLREFGSWYRGREDRGIEKVEGIRKIVFYSY